LKQYCGEVFISCREEQQQEIKKSYQTITDTYLNLGPNGGILSAFQSNPNCGWLVVACDLPLIDRKTISYLVRNRNCSVIATAYENPEDGNPEPLITIWEPKSYMVLLSFLAQGFSCPRKVLKNTDIHLLKAPWPKALTNVNTSEEAKKVKSLLQHKEMI
jgi:molybdopterin-guanine dinucleotide biosynthesis protein A